MTVEQKIAKKGYSLRCNVGYKNGEQTIVSYSALKNNREIATAKNKTALLKKI
jgi:hypothetical protein